LVALAVLGTAGSAFSQDKKVQEQKLESKAEKVKAAKFVDFATELELSIPALANLGERIDNARLASDPIDLALAAKLLEAAESAAAAGKKASITSTALLEEAVALAKRRGDSAELSMLAKLSSGRSADDLTALAKSLAQKKPEAVETKLDLHGDLVIDNHSHSTVFFAVNGWPGGSVPPHSVRVIHVHDAHFAQAHDHFGHRWSASFESGHYHRYIWVIHDPHHPH